MKVAVITPYYKEDLQMLARCHNSVAKQSYPDVTHFMVADGFPVNQVNAWDCEHITLPNCADSGDTPRFIGFAVASTKGFDAVCFLDADCWLEPDHIATLVGVMKESDRPVVTCPRNLYDIHGTFLARDTESDGKGFNDTNCYLIHRNAFLLVHAWITKPNGEGLVGDRYFWAEVCRSGVPMARSMKATVNYTTTFAFHYKQLGLPVPDHAKVIADLGDGYKTYNHKEVTT
jgi:glycosyltransferase involved in cell wall biosynthesis